MHVLIYVAGFLLWPILFGALARRLLGAEVGRARRVLSGLAGIGAGAVMSNAVTRGAWGIWNFIAYVIFAVLGTLAAVALLDFLIRPAAVGHLRRSFGPVPHPVRAARRRIAHGRRYASIISAFRRHGLLSSLPGRNRGATIEHRNARERRLGTQLSTRRVLVLEFIDGTPLREAGALLAHPGVQRADLARRLLETFLAQVLEAGVINADPHPGNVLLLADGTLAQIDFGSVVRLHATQRLALVRLLMAVDRQDPELLRDALFELTTSGPGPGLDELDRALAGFLTQRLGPGARPGAEMFNDLLALVSRFGLAFDPQLAGVFRALMTLEGTLRVLDPEFAIVEEARSLAEKAGHQAFGPGAFGQAAGEDLLKVAPLLRRMPGRLDRITRAMERNEWGYNIRLLAHEDDRRLAQRFLGRAILAFLSAAIGLVSALLIGVSNGISVATGVPLAQALGYLGLVIATVLGMRVLVAVIRDRVI